MDWISTPESSSIVRFKYEKDANLLTVEFKKTGSYQYFDVPETVFEAMCVAPSKGEYLAGNIKGVFRYARV